MLKKSTNMPQGTRRARRRKEGPSVLALAWIGLAFALIAGVGWLVLTPPQTPEEQALVLTLDNNPEKFAPAQWTDQVAAAVQAMPEVSDASPAGPMQIDLAEQQPATAVSSGDPQQKSGGAKFGVEGVREETLPSGAKRIIVPAAKSDATAETAPETDPQNMAEVLGELGDGAVVIKMADAPKQQNSAPSSQTTTKTRTEQKGTGSAPGVLDPAFRGIGEYGHTPKIAADGRKPARYYARGFSAPEDQPRLSIMIAGLGLDAKLTQAAIALPEEVSLAFAPYAKDLPTLAAKARAEGHELLVELPMESAGVDSQQLGPAALMTTQSETGNRRRLDWVLSRFEGFFGVTNYLGSTFSADSSAMTHILFALKGSGLAYIDDTALARAPAQSMTAAYARTDILLTPRTADLEGMLQQIEMMTQERTHLLVKIYASPAILTQLDGWIDTLPQKGITLAPVSALVDNL